MPSTRCAEPLQSGLRLGGTVLKQGTSDTGLSAEMKRVWLALHMGEVLNLRGIWAAVMENVLPAQLVGSALRPLPAQAAR